MTDATSTPVHAADEHTPPTDGSPTAELSDEDKDKAALHNAGVLATAENAKEGERVSVAWCARPPRPPPNPSRAQLFASLGSR